MPARRLLFTAVLAGLTLGLLPSTAGQADAQTLVSSDEFNGPAGRAPNPATWSYLTGGSGWGNNELETYTTRTANASLDGSGDLAITARKETYKGTDGIVRNYTSARIYANTPIQYGRIEARIKLPIGQGLWPAMWTLGASVMHGTPWPNCGEIDIMEAINGMQVVSGTVHGPTSYGGAYALTAMAQPADKQSLGGSWHIYAIDWTASSIVWYLDGQPYFTLLKSQMPTGDQWEFGQPHYLQLNLAVGGNIPGSPDASTVFPATMLVDYVRVYNN